MIKTAIIGFGMSGKDIHFPILNGNNDFELSYVVSKNPNTKTFIKEHNVKTEVVDTFDDLLSKDFDLAIITSPNETHFPYAKALLEIGKHVIGEKPFVETSEEMHELMKLAKERYKLLRVFHNRQFDGDFLTVQGLLDLKRLGEIKEAKIRFDRFRPNLKGNWREEEGVMAGIYYDLAPHLVDYAYRLFGLPNDMSLRLYKDRDVSVVDDHFEILFSYDWGPCYIGGSVMERYEALKFELIGSKATFRKFGTDDPFAPTKETKQTLPSSEMKLNDGTEIRISSEPSEHYKYYEEIASEIKQNKFNKEELLRNLHVIELLQKLYENQQ